MRNRHRMTSSRIQIYKTQLRVTVADSWASMTTCAHSSQYRPVGSIAWDHQIPCTSRTCIMSSCDSTSISQVGARCLRVRPLRQCDVFCPKKTLMCSVRHMQCTDESPGVRNKVTFTALELGGLNTNTWNQIVSHIHSLSSGWPRTPWLRGKSANTQTLAEQSVAVDVFFSAEG